MPVFFKVKTTEEVLEIVKGFDPVEGETVSLREAFGRVLYEDVFSPEDLPGFPRSSMDGYAVRAGDTYGASESLPVFLEVVGEVTMGEIPARRVGPGEAVKISTGGMIPEGADGVVMVEYCHVLDEKTIEVIRAVSPQENIILPDDDISKGSLVLGRGRRLRPQDLGAMAGLGILEVKVYRQPRIAIISTGDEVIPPGEKPKPGQIRDINTYTLGAFCEQNGAVPLYLGLCRDEFEPLRESVEKGLRGADSVWISGGSSLGTRDLTVNVLESFDSLEILVHGISISPGKPTIIGKAGARAVFGLPGHTASAMVVAEVFLRPFLSALAGQRVEESEAPVGKVDARLTRNIESAGGRDDFVRVRLIKEDEGWAAEPIFGKSGLISTLVEADGLVRIDRNTEGLYQDQKVQVLLLRPW
ncbi:MAG: molybdopterin molybdenumtransferase MoeA [Deltaproteobacteria bacterium]|nr:molybdopterin molybdenumtransferase MoeA [Deltaproteobacteria bacterium]MBW2129892.1 molybdopterin molybdenumtransferase MoeA [Deltaproteobacteria bacterium]MBW2304970.1 molybdopterin molybdenumtransferase MoeA [Deltaproteobacteria bacterium]